MQARLQANGTKYIRYAAAAAAFAALAYLLRRPIVRVAGLVLGASAAAFAVRPLAARFERRLGRSGASLAALVAVIGAVALLLWALLPAIVRELLQLGQALPRSVAQLTGWARAAAQWLEAHVPGLRLPEAGLSGALPGSSLLSGSKILSNIAAGTLTLAGNAAGALSNLSLVLMLAFFFLCERERLLLRLELLVPQRYRRTAVRMGSAVVRELRLYLRGQLLIAAAVGALAAAGLALAGVRSALVLGGVVGLLNMVPYFGPFIGGIPAVLIALGDSLTKAALAAGVLTVVQQLDNALISPRIMGSLTGFSPAAVLVAIYAGAQLAGVVGMLLALPAMMSIRTVFRVFVQRAENI